ncbi:MAG: arginine deiminase family protein [Nocardioides sp.]
MPNTLYTRDTTCWLYGGLTMNPLYWPARKDETILYKAIYEFHPTTSGRPSGGETPTRTGARPPSRAATSCPSATAWC